MIRIGPKCRLHGTRPELTIALIVLDGILRKHGEVVMMISHGMDGVHTRASIHYAGGAEDLVFAMLLDMAVKQQIVDEWKASVGPDFDILFENPGTSNEHAHVEYQPKEPYK
jgi:hypothetical protein